VQCVSVQVPSFGISSTSDSDEFSRIEFPQDGVHQKVWQNLRMIVSCAFIQPICCY